VALRGCVDCGGKVSTLAAACPHCGRPMSPPVECEGCGEEFDRLLGACPRCGRPDGTGEAENEEGPVGRVQQCAKCGEWTREERSHCRKCGRSFTDPMNDRASSWLSVRGRITRKEYFQYFLLPILVLACLWQVPELRPLVQLLVLWPLVIGSVKRSHDIGLPGWMYPAYLVLGGFGVAFDPETLFSVWVSGLGIWLALLTLLRGNDGPNKYGPTPGKYPNSHRDGLVEGSDPWDSQDGAVKVTVGLLQSGHSRADLVRLMRQGLKNNDPKHVQRTLLVALEMWAGTLLRQDATAVAVRTQMTQRGFSSDEVNTAMSAATRWATKRDP
jgi:uncharacterized membrane protein YhaH (DUF805 family)